MTIHSCRYLPARALVKGKRVLDIACGEGLGVGLLLEWGAKEVVGVDISNSAIDRAKDIYNDFKNLRLETSDAVEFLIRSEEEFDIIISTETVEHVDNPVAFVEQLALHAQKGTTVILTCPNDYAYFGRGHSINPYHKKQYSFYDFRTMTEKYLGEASWYLGTTNSGFSAVQMDFSNTASENHILGIRNQQQSESNIVSGSSLSKNRLKPSAALFYMGIWGQKTLPAAYQSSFPSSSVYRLQDFTSVSSDVGIGKTHQIAFVIDQHGWAFDNIVTNMTPFLDGRYKVTKFCVADYEDKSELISDIFINNSFDNVHFMWREFLFSMLSNKKLLTKLQSKMNVDEATLAEYIAKPTITTSVYDHLFLEAEELATRAPYFNFVDGYSTSSKLLNESYSNNCAKAPNVETSDGVNLEFFKPARELRKKRARSPGRTIKIGWVGNSSWGTRNPAMGDDPKGLHSILVPAIERLAIEGYPVALVLADKNIQQRTRDEMVDYYAELDILVCSSSFEGTPNPILEAMACGVAFVSTNVGIVTEVAGPKQKQFVLNSRDVNAMYRHLKKIMDQPSIIKELETENLAQIVDWDWKEKTTKWLALFKQAETRNSSYGSQYKKMFIESQLKTWNQEAESKLFVKSKKLLADKENTIAQSRTAAKLKKVVSPRKIYKGIRWRILKKLGK